MRIVLADDHAVVTEGLRLCFEQVPGCEVVGIATDAAGVVDLVRRQAPDVAIIDISMPDASGLEAVRTLTGDPDLQTACIILSMHRDPAYVREAMQAGARAYLVKSSPFEELRQAVDAVLAGKTYISPEIAGSLVEPLDDARPPEAEALQRLTRRERQTVTELARGMSVKEIAYAWDLSPKTVHAFRSSAMQKLQVGSIAELTRLAIRAGIIDLD